MPEKFQTNPEQNNEVLSSPSEAISESVDYEEQMKQQEMKALLRMATSLENEGDREELLYKLDHFMYKGQSLDAILSQFDTMSSPKDGNREIKMKDPRMEYLVDDYTPQTIRIPWGSDLGKLLQLKLELGNKSVQFQDFQDLSKKIDGKIGEDSIKAITQYQEMQTRDFVDTMQEEKIENLEDQAVHDWVKSSFDNVISGIKGTEEKNPELNNERNASIDVIDTDVFIRSYNTTSRIDLYNGDITIDIGEGEGKRIFPFSLHFKRNSDTGNILIENNIGNNNEIQKGIKITNFMNFITNKFIRSNTARDADDYRPFHAGIGAANMSIDINDSWINDTDVIDALHLTKILKDYNAEYNENIEELDIKKDILIDFLNDLYERHNRPQLRNKQPTRNKTNI